MVIHFRTAISTIQKPRKRIGFADCIRPADGLSQFLHLIPHFFRNDCFLCILENNPVRFWCLFCPLILVRIFIRAEIYGMSHILRLGKNIPHRCPTPHIRSCSIIVGTTGSKSPLGKIIGWTFDLFLRQYPCNLIGSFSLQRHPVYPAYHLGSFFVNYPLVFIFLTFPVTVNGIIGGVFSLHSPCTKHRSHFPAGVTNVPLIHDV